MGVAAGKHTIFNFIVKILSLPKDERARPKYKIPACHALDDQVATFGDLMVVGGVDGDYHPLPGHETSIGAQLREPGRAVALGSIKRIELIHLELDGDYKGLGRLGATSVSAGSVDSGTYKGCRQCYHDRRRPDRVAPQRNLPVSTLILTLALTPTLSLALTLTGIPDAGVAQALRRMRRMHKQDESKGLISTNWGAPGNLLLPSPGGPRL